MCGVDVSAVHENSMFRKGNPLTNGHTGSTTSHEKIQPLLTKTTPTTCFQIQKFRRSIFRGTRRLFGDYPDVVQNEWTTVPN